MRIHRKPEVKALLMTAAATVLARACYGNVVARVSGCSALVPEPDMNWY